MDLSLVTPPSVGRIVHYTVRDGQRRGEVRAAIITRTFHQEPYVSPTGEITAPLRVNWAVNLTIFPDLANPAMHEESHASSALFDPDGKPGTWRYQPTQFPAAAQELKVAEQTFPDEAVLEALFDKWLAAKAAPEAPPEAAPEAKGKAKGKS